MPEPTASNESKPERRSNHSAGIVVYRMTGSEPEILLVHPGGPFWAKKDTNGWSMPKGEYDPETEDAESAAVREFEEETGHRAPAGERIELPAFRAGRKTIRAWLVEGDLDAAEVTSNNFEMEWPPKSGTMQSFPEVDRAEWFSIIESRTKLHKGQLPLCDHIAHALEGVSR